LPRNIGHVSGVAKPSAATPEKEAPTKAARQTILQILAITAPNIAQNQAAGKKIVPIRINFKNGAGADFSLLDLALMTKLKPRVKKQIPVGKSEKVSSQKLAAGASPSELIDQRIAELGDWRGETLRRMRKLIKEADPEIVEEWKWMGTPVWERDGIICTGESYKAVVKLTFAKGASLKDPARLFNSSLDGNVRRAIDIREGEQVDAQAFKTLIRQAAALNVAGKKAKAKRQK
jgi:hypothetical protein